MGVNPVPEGGPRVSRVARKPVLALLAAFVAAVVVSPVTVSAASVTIRITSRLEPAELTVAPGTRIRFANADDERHRMRSQSGPAEFDSHNLEPGQSYSMTLRAKGTYAYLDERDDENSRYFGRIVVGGGSSGTGSGSKASAPASGSAPVSMAGPALRPLAGP